MKRSLLALALVAVLPFAAQADDKLSYSYVEADYVNLDGDERQGEEGTLHGNSFFGLFECVRCERSAEYRNGEVTAD